MNKNFFRALGLTLVLGLLTGCGTTRHPAKPAAGLLGTRATYCRAPRGADHRVDVDRLIAELVDVHANTYSFCIHAWSTDWEDLQLILPAAAARGIKVWGSVVPPSESFPRTKTYAEPFRLDYVRWAAEFAKLSVRYPNLVAWSIDDFTHNLKIYTPDYVRQMRAAAAAINPRLAFVPCCYYPTLTTNFVANYAPLLDGILFPYRHESAGANLQDPSLVERELSHLKALFGPGMPIVLDIYATAHSRLGATTPAYVAAAMEAGHRAADGVMIYCHQDPIANADKYAIIKRNFGDWSAGR